jgi:hypothetical protein
MLSDVTTASLNNVKNAVLRIHHLTLDPPSHQLLLILLYLKTPCNLMPSAQEPCLQVKRNGDALTTSVSTVEVLVTLLSHVLANITPQEGCLTSLQVWEMTPSSLCRSSLPGPCIFYITILGPSCFPCLYHTSLLSPNPNLFYCSPGFWCLYLLYGPLFCTQTCLSSYQTCSPNTCPSC